MPAVVAAGDVTFGTLNCSSGQVLRRHDILLNRLCNQKHLLAMECTRELSGWFLIPLPAWGSTSNHLLLVLLLAVLSITTLLVGSRALHSASHALEFSPQLGQLRQQTACVSAEVPTTIAV